MVVSYCDFICISKMTNGGENCVTCLLAISISALDKHFFKPFAYFFIGLFFCLFVCFLVGSVFILDISYMLVMGFAIFFPIPQVTYSLC